MTRMYITLIVLAVFVGGLSVLVAQDNGISISMGVEEQQKEVIETATDSAVVLQHTNPVSPTTEGTEGYIPQPPRVQQPEPPVEVVETEPTPDTKEVEPEPTTTTPPVVEQEPEPIRVVEPVEVEPITTHTHSHPEPIDTEPVLTRETEPLPEPEKVIETTEQETPTIVVELEGCVYGCEGDFHTTISATQSKTRMTMNGVDYVFDTDKIVLSKKPNNIATKWTIYAKGIAKGMIVSAYTNHTQISFWRDKEPREIVEIGTQKIVATETHKVVEIATKKITVNTADEQYTITKTGYAPTPTPTPTTPPTDRGVGTERGNEPDITINTSDNGNNGDVITPTDTGDNGGNTQTIGSGSAYKTSRVERTYRNGYVYGRYQNKFYRKSSYGSIIAEQECTYTKDNIQHSNDIYTKALLYFVSFMDIPDDICVIVLGSNEYNTLTGKKNTGIIQNMGLYYTGLHTTVVREGTGGGYKNTLKTIRTMYHELIHAWQDKQTAGLRRGIESWHKTKEGSEFVRIVGFYNNNGKWAINNPIYKRMYGGGWLITAPYELSADILGMLGVGMFVESIMGEMSQYNKDDLWDYYIVMRSDRGMKGYAYDDIWDWIEEHIFNT